jgi:cyanophycin synthetase
MRVLETRVMRGPNIWSNYRQHLIVMTLDLEELETRPTHRINGFSQGIRTLLPSLDSHRCSEGHKGGFFQRVEQGTWMGHVIEHIALELQSLAGMECGYGRTRSTDITGVYHVVFAYRIEDAGRYAGKAAIRVAKALIEGRKYNIEADIRALREIAARYRQDPGMAAIIEEARKAHIPVRIMKNSLVILGYGRHQRKFRINVADSTSGIGMEIAQDKFETKLLLERAFIPTPRGAVAYTMDELTTRIKDMQFPVVLKPLNGNQGRGITTNISHMEQLPGAFQSAAAVSVPVVVEEHLTGDDFRFLVVNYKLVAVAMRTPARVRGNGKSTIGQLIIELNNDPRRGDGHENMLTKVVINDPLEQVLLSQGFNLLSVPRSDETVQLSATANISTGGTAEDVTDIVHPFNVFLAERIARIINLDVCGIDIIAKDVALPLCRDNGSVLEVNAGPGLRMHLSPEKGLARNVAKPIIQMLFPENNEGRIPLVAIAGSTGKTMIAKLVVHFAECAGKMVGAATSEGIYLCGQSVDCKDCTDAESSQTVLFDPQIDYAVIECAGECILDSGLPFDTSDISIITNISADHLHFEGIKTVEDLVRLKMAVPRTTIRRGYALLNADDEEVIGMRNDLDCRIALYSTTADNAVVAQHCSDGGIAAVVEDGFFTLINGRWKYRVDDVMVFTRFRSLKQNLNTAIILPAILTAYLHGAEPEMIRSALRSFIKSPAVEIQLKVDPGSSEGLQKTA